MTMKLTFLCAAALAAAGAVMPVRADEPAKEAAAAVAETPAAHREQQARYEQLAAAQQAVIDEHEAMRAAEQKRLSDKYPNKAAKEMIKHCSKLIKAATMLRDEYTDFARWHKMRAAELERKP